MQIKAADDKQPQIDALEAKLREPGLDAWTRRQIDDDVRAMRAGIKGEREAAYDIELYFGRSRNWVTIHDLRIEVDGYAAQIDHLLINRLVEIWVCESKHFVEGVSVNAQGEWSRYYRRKSVGMASPIEQNAKHIFLLERVFDDGLVTVPRRTVVPIKPNLRSLVLVSKNASIGRPRGDLPALHQVIKADQLKTRVFDEFDNSPPHRLWRLIGKERLEAFGRQLVALHRPQPVVQLREGPLAQRKSIEEGPVEKETRERRSRGSGHRCVSCGEPVSFAIVRFCWSNERRFGGKVYCMSCQKTFASG